MGDSILSCIEPGDTIVPVEDENGEEYLGKKYVLKKIEKPVKKQVQSEEVENLEEISDIPDIFDEEESNEKDENRA